MIDRLLWALMVAAGALLVCVAVLGFAWGLL
jgi:hypothetical protein